jgi:hypothetical protein
MVVTRLACRSCEVTVEGAFETPRLAGLTRQQQDFVTTFLAARGNIKLMERRLGISYPTVRSRLEAVQKALGVADLGAGEEHRKDIGDVLRRLEEGEISVDDAVDELG